MKILFDMDGTFVNLYGVENWLEDLINERVRPYKVARPLCDMTLLRKEMIRLKNKGYTLEVVSWTSKKGTSQYNKRVRYTKKKWIKSYNLPFDKIHIVQYGTDKSKFGNATVDILIDDEEPNRNKFKNSVNPQTQDIIQFLQTL